MDTFSSLEAACRSTGDNKPKVSFYDDGITAVDAFRVLWNAVRRKPRESPKAPCVIQVEPERVGP